MEELASDLDMELAMIEQDIRMLQVRIKILKKRKRKLLVKVRDLDMDIVLQCIVEKGLTSSEVLRLIDNADC